MPTLGWIQETSLDRFWETGSDPALSALPKKFYCRYCDQVFDSIPAREQHELEHPFSNPVLYFRDKEIGSSRLLITTKVNSSDVTSRNVSNLRLNGRTLESLAQLIEALQCSNNDYLNIVYGNEALEKKLSIEVCIADKQELNEVDQAFKAHFASDSLSGQQLASFKNSVNHCSSVEQYINGLVRYIHGLKAKDHQSEITGFEHFDIRFNQSLASLIEYNTPLASAVRAVIRFNRNDFGLMQKLSGLPELDNAAAFFRGADLASSGHVQPSAQLPVDQATGFILQNLLPHFSSLNFDEFENLTSLLSRKLLSLQDSSKIHYLYFRKAADVHSRAAVIKYRKKLRNDEVFNHLIGDA